MAPLVVPALCLLVFYGPILMSAGSVVTGLQEDNVGHMLISLGDDRPGGRFFHYFDLSANARMWGQDVKYSPLHFIRLISIALGSSLIGWGMLLVMVHLLVFMTIYYYSRKALQASTTAALTGATVAFFAVSWIEWTALVYWTAGAVLLVVSICEYWLYVKTQRRRHLLMVLLANVFQPYVTQAQALIPTQFYLLGAVLLMASLRKGDWRSRVSPLILFVWPLTILGWIPILAPLLFVVGSGLTVREAVVPLTWGLDLSTLSQALGLLFLVPSVVGDLLMKLGLNFLPPNSFLFGSFLFVPGVLALWRSGQRSLRILVIGVILYVLSILAGDIVSVPSALVMTLGFSRVFALPVLSGFVVAAAMDLEEFGHSETTGIRILHIFYGMLLASAVIGFVALLMVNAQTLTAVASRFGLVGSGTLIPLFLRDTRVFAAGMALGLAGYFLFMRARRSWVQNSGKGAALSSIALAVAIIVPSLSFGYGQWWYQRPPELDAMLSPPSEFQFLRERIPSYEYRVGIVMSSEMKLAQGDWKGFWAMVSQPQEHVLSNMRENDLRMRQGLAFGLPTLHFLAPSHFGIRRDGNPFLQRLESPEAQFLTLRNVIVHPESERLEAYGLRYWLSNFDLDQHNPQKFVRLYQGEVSAVFENQDAKPVAYFVQQPSVPLAMKQVPEGAVVEFSTQEGGKLSIHLDLRGMDLHALNSDGRTVPLVPEPSGLRWMVDVPPGSRAVILTAREAPLLKFLAIGAAVLFFLLLILWALVWRPGRFPESA